MAGSSRRSPIVIAVRRAERDRLKNAIQDLSQREARAGLARVAQKKRLCALVEGAEGILGDQNIGETDMIVKGR
jgi:hypothetical protein